MKALVCVKRVIDYNVKPRVKADGSGVDLANVKMSMNPFDEIAVEEAIRLKEKGVVSEIVAVSVGVAKSQETLRTALAMGADRAVLVQVEDGTEVEPLAVAKIIKGIADEEQPALIITGKQAIDDDSNQVGQIVAALLGRPQGTFANEVSVEGDAGIVPAEVATPLAVVLNELLQNAVDHAFGTSGGRVVVQVATESDRIDLAVRDDGRGLPDGFSFESATGLGLSIVRALVVSDLGGSISASSPTGSGTVVSLSVPLHGS